MAVTHFLKTDPVPFDDVVTGKKTFEIRLDDRNYKVGDILHLIKTRHTGEEMKGGKPLVKTGDAADVEVIHILRGPIYGLLDGWVIMSIRVKEISEDFV